MNLNASDRAARLGQNKNSQYTKGEAGMTRGKKNHPNIYIYEQKQTQNKTVLSSNTRHFGGLVARMSRIRRHATKMASGGLHVFHMARVS